MRIDLNPARLALCATIALLVLFSGCDATETPAVQGTLQPDSVFVVSVIPDLDLSDPEIRSIDLTNHFGFSEGTSLSYSVTQAGTSVEAVVRPDDNVLELRALEQGRTLVSVSAFTEQRDEASLEFSVQTTCLLSEAYRFFPLNPDTEWTFAYRRGSSDSWTAWNEVYEGTATWTLESRAGCFAMESAVVREDVVGTYLAYNSNDPSPPPPRDTTFTRNLLVTLDQSSGTLTITRYSAAEEEVIRWRADQADQTVIEDDVDFVLGGVSASGASWAYRLGLDQGLLYLRKGRSGRGSGASERLERLP